MRKSIIFVCLIVLSALSCLQAENYSIKVIKENSDELVVEAQFDKPIEQLVTKDSKNFISFNIPGLLQTNVVGAYPIPFVSKNISLPSNELNSEILEIKTETIVFNKDAELISNNVKNSLKFQNYNLDYTGMFRDVPLYTLTIFPLNISSNKVVRIKKIKIRIWSETNTKNNEYVYSTKNKNDKNILESVLLNGKSVNYTSKQSIPFNKSIQRYKSGRYKIIVDEDGLYQITYQDLINSGVDLVSVNPKNLRLSNKGQEIAIYFKGSRDLSFDQGDYFEFWGETNRNTLLNDNPDMYSDPFSDVNVYWLEEANSFGLRMVEENGALIVSNPASYVVPIYFKEKLHFEKNQHFEHFGRAGANLDLPSHTLDLWYYNNLIKANGNYSFDAFVPYPYETGTSSVFATVAMRGRSFQDWEEEQNLGLVSHLVEARLNDNSTNNKIGESSNWKDQELYIIKNVNGLSQSLLSHGINSLKLNMTQEDNNISDIILLNWFDIEYLRKYRAYQNTLKFRGQDGIATGYLFQFEIDGFTNSNIELYKKGVSKIVNPRIDFYTDPENFRSYRISFQDSIFYSGIEYVALTKDQKKKPIEIIPDNPWIPNALTNVSLLDNLNSADYLIVTNELLYDNVLQLQQFHDQRGLNTAIVKVQDIYDEFNYGIKSPLAIKDFIKFIYNNWDQSHKLYFVNLVGTASENYKNPPESKPDLVPTLFFQTKEYGASASDFLYSLVSGDENDIIPDLNVARIPSRNNTEFLNYMDKLNSYSSYSDNGNWTNKVLMISGNDATTKELGSYPHAFRSQNQRILNYKIPEQYFMRKLNTIKDTNLVIDPNFGSTTDLINYFDDGLAYINFLGHGGSGIWADAQLFAPDDIERLNNGSKLPFVTSMTCFTGAFENKSFATIADKLITVADKGAIGVYASSGVGWLHNDFAVGWSLTENLFEKKLSIGESILLSKINYLSNGVYFYDDGATTLYDYSGLRKSMVNQYNLLGEPNIYLPNLQKNLSINIDNNLVSVGDTVNFEVLTPYSSGELYVELTNENNEPLIEQFEVILNTGNNFSFAIPQSLDKQIGYIKAFAIDNNYNSHGSMKIAVKKSLLDSVTTSPENPKIGEPVNLFVHIHSDVPIENVSLKNLKHVNNKKLDFILTKVSDTLYTTATSLGPYNTGGRWYFTIEIVDTLGSVATYHQQSFTIIDPRPDLEVIDKSFKFTGINDLQIEVEVFNNSEQNNVVSNIGFFDRPFSSGASPFYFISENFSANEKKTINFTVDNSLLAFDKKFTVFADYVNQVNEKNESNNVDSSLVYNSFILVQANEGTNDTLLINDFAKIFINPNALTQNSTLSLSTIFNSNILNPESQPDYKYIPFGDSQDSVTINLKLHNVNALLNEPAYVAFKIDTSLSIDSLNHLGIYRFNSNLNQWIKVYGDSIKNGYKYIKTHTLGEFALFYVNDDESPVIEITVNGRVLRNNMLVPSTPELAVILQDENGIDISNGFLIRVDDDTISRSDMNLPESVAISNAISVLTSPYFQSGEHTLTVEAIDANGNRTIKPINFTTSGNFNVKVYGNYPNPFKDDTYISYYVDSNEALDDFSVKIYTVSGRMIKEIDTSDERFRLPDYYEILWDGRDEGGNLVANGVYFAIIKAKFEGNEVEHRLKMAKLK